MVKGEGSSEAPDTRPGGRSRHDDERGEQRDSNHGDSLGKRNLKFRRLGQLDQGNREVVRTPWCGGIPFGLDTSNPRFFRQVSEWLGSSRLGRRCPQIGPQEGVFNHGNHGPTRKESTFVFTLRVLHLRARVSPEALLPRPFRPPRIGYHRVRNPSVIVRSTMRPCRPGAGVAPPQPDHPDRPSSLGAIVLACWLESSKNDSVDKNST